MAILFFRTYFGQASKINLPRWVDRDGRDIQIELRLPRMPIFLAVSLENMAILCGIRGSRHDLSAFVGTPWA